MADKRFIVKNGLEAPDILVGEQVLLSIENDELVFEGITGKLLSITDLETSTTFIVLSNEGTPSIELTEDLLKLVPLTGRVAIGEVLDNFNDELQVSGTTNSTKVRTNSLTFTNSSNVSLVTNLVENNNLVFRSSVEDLAVFSSNPSLPTYAVQDAEGQPLLEVFSNGDTYLTPIAGKLFVNTDTGNASLNIGGNIAVTGLVDGRDISADGSTLDNLVTAMGDVETALDTINGV